MEGWRHEESKKDVCNERIYRKSPSSSPYVVGDPPRPIVVSDGVLALIAGSDTTAIVTAMTVYSLLRNPTAYKRLQQEVDRFYPRGEDSLDSKHYKNMTYLEAVM